MIDNPHELEAPPWRRVESTLLATSRALRRAYDSRLAPVGLNQSEASIVALVDEEGKLSQTEVARRIGMRRAAAGALVDKLEGLGLIVRVPSPSDRRVWHLVVTPEARETIVQIKAIDAQLRRELRAGIPRDERRALAATLEQLRANLARVTDDSAD